MRQGQQRGKAKNDNNTTTNINNKAPGQRV